MKQSYAPFQSVCPACQELVTVTDGVCENCGFPFVCELEAKIEPPIMRAGSLVSRILVFIALLAFIIYFSNYNYILGEGYTKEVIGKLEQAGLATLQMRVTGPEDFVRRVQLALTLLKSRGGDYFERVNKNITSIEFAPEEKLEIVGRRIYLTGISAYIDPASGETRVRISGAYLSGLGELYDRDIFYLAGVLVHEMRHRELFESGLNVGGLAEEYEAESTAYDALVRMGAPRSLTYSIWQFLINPHHPRYKGWERYYRQYGKL